MNETRETPKYREQTDSCRGEGVRSRVEKRMGRKQHILPGAHEGCPASTQPRGTENRGTHGWID